MASACFFSSWNLTVAHWKFATLIIPHAVRKGEGAIPMLNRRLAAPLSMQQTGRSGQCIWTTCAVNNGGFCWSEELGSCPVQNKASEWWLGCFYDVRLGYLRPIPLFVESCATWINLKLPFQQIRVVLWQILSVVRFGIDTVVSSIGNIFQCKQ
jgi:hypothetical protein